METGGVAATQEIGGGSGPAFLTRVVCLSLSLALAMLNYALDASCKGNGGELHDIPHVSTTAWLRR